MTGATGCVRQTLCKAQICVPSISGVLWVYMAARCDVCVSCGLSGARECVRELVYSGHGCWLCTAWIVAQRLYRRRRTLTCVCTVGEAAGDAAALVSLLWHGLVRQGMSHPSCMLPTHVSVTGTPASRSWQSVLLWAQGVRVLGNADHSARDCACRCCQVRSGLFLTRAWRVLAWVSVGHPRHGARVGRYSTAV